MSDLGNVFKDMKAASQRTRAKNRDHAPKVLEEAGIEFHSNNGGIHIIIEDRIDFWPGTGKWIVRGGRTGRGVRELVKEVNE